MAINQLTRRGLVSAWDIGNDLSYTGSGATIVDLEKKVNCTIINSPTFNSGNWGYLTLNGTNQAFNTPTTVASNIYAPTTNPLTIGALFKKNTPIVTQQLLIGYFNGGNPFYLLDTNAGSGNIRFRIRDSAGTLTTATTPLAYNDNQWHTVFCTRTAGTIRIYIDGVQVATTTGATTGAIITSACALVFGSVQPGGTYWNGSIGMGCYYNVELTPQEILINHQYLLKRIIH